jgi:uncharacterized protein YbaP (TraB family)
MQLIFRILILVLLPFMVSAQTKKYPSLLWKISGKGLSKPSYVYGTMHVSNRVAYHLSDQFFDALKSVDVVGLETNPGEWLQNMEKYGDLEQFSNAEMNRSMYRFYDDAFQFNIPDKKIYNNLLSYDAEIINGLLFRNNASKENFEESTYIDLFIYQVASKLNKQVISLEDFGLSEVKAKLAAVPDKKTDEEEDSYKRKNYKEMYQMGEKIEDAYRKGDLTTLDSLTQLSDSKNMIKFLLEDRNTFFVNNIDSVLKSKSIFVGVGAAHLGGKNGVIEMLRKLGYTVEPIMPKASKKADDEKDAFDKQFKSVKFIKQGSADSVINVNTPGRLYTLAKTSLVTYQLCADMVNGNFFTLTTFKTFGALQQLNDDLILKRVDSLLFENIPGKIITKEKLAINNGIKGIDITTKTKKGDMQRYHIYAYNDVLYIVKLGGKGDYALSNDGKQFFNSIQFRTANGLYENTFTPPNAGFEVKLPAVPSYQKNKQPAQISLIEDMNVYDKSITGYIGVKHATYNDFNYLEEDTFELNVLARSTLKNFNCEEKLTKELDKSSTYPSIKLSGKTKDGFYLNGKIYINGIHYYLAYSFGKSAMPFTNPFFESFKITDFKYTSPIKDVNDDDYYFKAKDEVSVGLKVSMDSIFAIEYKKLNDSIEKPKNRTFDYYSGTKNYYSPSSTEYVRISYEKYNDYEYRELADIKKKIVENLNPDKTLLVTRSKFEDGKDGFLFSCLLKDTATQRAIATKVIMTKDRIYRLSVPMDTVHGMKGWSKGFYDSFKPKDTLIGKSVIENKFNVLVNDLFSNDSTKRNNANYSFQNSVGTDKAFLNDYLSLLNRSDFNKLESETRAQLLVNSGVLESEKVIEPLKKLYTQYEDSAYLQICIIKGLAYIKTKAAYATILQLLTTEPPLVGDEPTISNVFDVFYDSLVLTKPFFPSFLTLSRFDEYKQSVFKLLATLQSENLISADDYSSQKDNVLMEASFELKRYNANQNKEVKNYGYQSDSDLAKLMADELAATLYNTYSSGLTKKQAKTSSYERNSYPYLVNLSTALAPFYKKDEKVKLFFSKLGRVKSSSIALPVFVKLAKQSVVWNDTLNTHFSKQANTSNLFYNLLEEEKIEKQFDKQYLTQEHFAKSLLISELKLDNANNYQTTRFNADSLQLIKKIDAKNRYEKGKIYIYRMRSTKGDGEKWHTVFVPETKKGLTTNLQVININIIIEKTKTTTYYEDEILQQFYLKYRNRATIASYGDY